MLVTFRAGREVDLIDPERGHSQARRICRNTPRSGSTSLASTTEYAIGAEATLVDGMLHVTNGDVVAELLRADELANVLPWREVLHEGPVPAGLSDADLRSTRAGFIASCGWSSYEEALVELEAQHQALAAADGAVLWFERDLFDQLQLLQVLVQLGEKPAALVDLGEPAERPLDLAALERRPVRLEQRELAARAWSAFRATEPRELAELGKNRTEPLPFLGAALRRLLEELPAVEDGLARSERELLEAVAGGASNRHDAFEEFQRREERPFMGDSVFWRRIDGLARAPVPLLDESDGLTLTDAGREVLAGKADHLRLNGIDRWLGGAHLADEAAWRWDRSRGRLASA